jgi:hypothetical protein
MNEKKKKKYIFRTTRPFFHFSILLSLFPLHDSLNLFTSLYPYLLHLYTPTLHIHSYIHLGCYYSHYAYPLPSLLLETGKRRPVLFYHMFLMLQ